MCRLLAAISTGLDGLSAWDFIRGTPFCLQRQSWSATERPDGGDSEFVYSLGRLNGDGHGLGWTDSRDDVARNFRSILPLWSDPNIVNVSAAVRSSVIFGHTRAAGPDMGVSHSKCQPFTFGRFLWMHNGQVPKFRSIEWKLSLEHGQETYHLAQACGGTDSAWAFALFMNKIGFSNCMQPLGAERMSETLRAVVEDLMMALNGAEPPVLQEASLNFVVSDGITMAATRFAWSASNPVNMDAKPPSLSYTCGAAFKPKPPESGVGVQTRSDYVMEEEGPTKVVIISSEPLTTSGEGCTWHEVPANKIITVHRGRVQEDQPALEFTISQFMGD